MLSLTIAGRPVSLAPGTSVQLVLHSPLFDEAVLRGSFTYSFAVPAGPNGPVYGFPERPDAATPHVPELPAELRDDDQLLLRGTQRVRSATAASYAVSLADGLSALATALSGRALPSFALGGLRTVPRFAKLPVYQGYAFNMPGLWVHARAVVAEPAAYDYLFAPVRNDDFRGAVSGRQATDPPLPPLTVNFFYPGDLTIFPPGGTFLFYQQDGNLYTDAGNYASPMGSMSQGDLPCCPWPRLRYVLRCAFEEVGLLIDEVAFFPGELADLVFVGNAELVDRGDAQHVAFHLADVLPDVTVAQLLQVLRTGLGLVVLLDATSGRVRTAFLADLVASPEVQDLTEWMVGTPEIALDPDAAVTLSSHGDAGDALTQDLATRQPTVAQVGEEVETVADLPTGRLTPLELRPRLVRQQEAFYQSTVHYTPATANTPPVTAVTWAYWCPALRTIDVNGGGPLLELGHCYTPVVSTPYPFIPATPDRQALPEMSQPAFNAGDPAGAARSSEVRLLFYRGWQAVTAGANAWHYPQLGPTSASGALSLLLDGETGAYETRLRTWLPVKLRGAVVKQQLRLSPLALAQLDLTRKVRLDGVTYFIRKLTGNLPLTKPVTVELVRV